jgi:hypothetical protein
MLLTPEAMQLFDDPDVEQEKRNSREMWAQQGEEIVSQMMYPGPFINVRKGGTELSKQLWHMLDVSAGVDVLHATSRKGIQELRGVALRFSYYDLGDSGFNNFTVKLHRGEKPLSVAPEDKLLELYKWDHALRTGQGIKPDFFVHGHVQRGEHNTLKALAVCRVREIVAVVMRKILEDPRAAIKTNNQDMTHFVPVRWDELERVACWQLGTFVPGGGLL